MQAKKVFLIGILGPVLAFATYRFVVSRKFNTKPNILVISVCSLTRDHLDLYGYRQRPTTPHLDAVLQKKAWIFDNAINGTPWTTIFHETVRTLRPRDFRRAGYTPLGDSHSRQVYRIPADPAHKKGWLPQSFNKDLSRLNELRNLLALPRKDPFFVIAHIRYPHFPMVDTFNPDSGWDRFLNQDERGHVQEYLRHPGLLARRVPMQLALTGNPDQLRKRLRDPDFAKASDENLLGLINDESYLREWRSQPDYLRDLEILRKIYDANIAYLDRKLAELVSLSGFPESVQRNTVVIFVGDHGEILEQRGHFTHGTSLYDESVRIPFAVVSAQAPAGGTRITTQVDMESIAKMLNDIVNGHSLNSLVESLDKGGARATVLRDCSDSQRGVRLGNQLKFIRDLRTGEAYLFDLQKDRGENFNIAAERPEQVLAMEALYWEEYPRFAKRSLANCASENMTR